MYSSKKSFLFLFGIPLCRGRLVPDLELSQSPSPMVAFLSDT